MGLKLKTLTQLAADLGRERTVVYGWYNDGELPGELVGSVLLFDQEACARAEELNRTRPRLEGRSYTVADYPRVDAATAAKMLTAQAAAKKIGLTERSLWRLVKRGHLHPSRAPDSSTRFDPAEIDDYCARPTRAA